MLSPSPRNTLNPSESPEIVAPLSPDTLLANLRTAVERATTDADRTKFWALVAKLEAELARRSDTMVEGTKGAVADLKSIMNADDHSLAKRATDLATQAGDNIAPIAVATAKEVKNMAGKAVEAAKTGDLSEVKKLAEGVRETISANGDKVLEYTGAAAITKLFEPFQKEWFAGIGAVLSNLWKLIAGIFSGKGFSMSEVIGSTAGKVEEKAGNVKEAAKEAFKNWADAAKKGVEVLNDPKKLNEAIENSTPAMIAKLEREFYGEGKMGEKQRENFAKVIKNANFGQETARRIEERIKTGWEIAKVSDISDTLLEVAFGNISLVSQLVWYGVIPMNRLIITTAQTAADSYRFNVSVIFEKLNLPSPPVISLSDEELKIQMADAVKQNPALKDMMLMQMYRINGIAASALGIVSTGLYAAANAAFLDTSHGVDGARLLWDHHTKKADKVLAGLEKMEQAILGGKTISVDSPLFAIKEQFAQVKENAQHLINAKADPARAKEFYSKVKLTTDPFTVTAKIQSSIGTQSGLAYELTETMHKFSQYQERLARPDFARTWRTLLGSAELVQMPRQVDKLALSFPNAQAATETFAKLAQQTWAYGPGALGAVFRQLPVAGLVIGGVNIAQGDWDKKLGEALSMASSVLIPFFGPIGVMLNSDTSLGIKYDKEKGGLEVTHLKENLLNLGMLGLDTAVLANALATGWKRGLLLSMTSRVTDIWKLGTDTIRVGNFIKHAAPKLVPQVGTLLRMAGAIPNKKLQAAAVFWLILWGSAYAMVKSGADLEKQLIKDGFWNSETKDITPKMSAHFAALDADKKRLLIDGFYTHFVERLTPDLPDSKTSFKDGTYVFVVKSRSDKTQLWTALNAHHTEFGEELRTLGVSLEVIAQDEHDENIKLRAEQVVQK